MDETSPSPIERCIDRWHEYLRTKDEAVLDDLLDPDVTFWSPVVFTPQEGREVTKLYLAAAGNTLAGTTDGSADAEPGGSSQGDQGGGFRYVRRVLQGHDAVLEFETTMAGMYVNGIDLITCDDDGRIVDFKVMIRPLQAINVVHEQMRAMLERLSAPGP